MPTASMTRWAPRLSLPSSMRSGAKLCDLEREFNLAAGFTAADDELPAFFYDEPLPPSNKTARFHGEEVHHMYDLLDQSGYTKYSR
ncbi:MAG UNVERIFIED_CONTAM: aldehyde ferredoxin oxidoreductase C-terminal domain-containing protein [Anaerolineae bacterium]